MPFKVTLKADGTSVLSTDSSDKHRASHVDRPLTLTLTLTLTLPLPLRLPLPLPLPSGVHEAIYCML